MPKAKPPITVVVSNGRYDILTPLLFVTTRSLILARILKMQGGVNASVEPGTYHFNAHRKGLNLVLSLDKVEPE